MSDGILLTLLFTACTLAGGCIGAYLGQHWTRWR